LFIYFFFFLVFLVFFHLCYEGAINLYAIKDINDRHGLEVQIMEFGQIPKQIFKLPHPERLVAADLIRSEICFSTQQTSLSSMCGVCVCVCVFF
jgi:hypothetical protein